MLRRHKWKAPPFSSLLGTKGSKVLRATHTPSERERERKRRNRHKYYTSSLFLLFIVSARGGGAFLAPAAEWVWETTRSLPTRRATQNGHVYVVFFAHAHVFFVRRQVCARVLNSQQPPPGSIIHRAHRWKCYYDALRLRQMSLIKTFLRSPNHILMSREGKRSSVLLHLKWVEILLAARMYRWNFLHVISFAQSVSESNIHTDSTVAFGMSPWDFCLSYFKHVPSYWWVACIVQSSNSFKYTWQL